MLCTFLFSQKSIKTREPLAKRCFFRKDHTAIQERCVPLGTTASGTALGVGSREFDFLQRKI